MQDGLKHKRQIQQVELPQLGNVTRFQVYILDMLHSLWQTAITALQQA
jgi:hypothetical protein